MMRPLLVHSSSKASGPLPRRVLHIEYATSRVLGDYVELDLVDAPLNSGRPEQVR
jgi:hypothetical protein